MRIYLGMNLLGKIGIGFVRPKETKNRGLKRRELRKRLGAGVVLRTNEPKLPRTAVPQCGAAEDFETGIFEPRSWHGLGVTGWHGAFRKRWLLRNEAKVVQAGIAFCGHLLPRTKPIQG